ncbi:MAG: outer membrane protein assembly factor BamB family protein [Candidatus Bathyarchaeia archaeon]
MQYFGNKILAIVICMLMIIAIGSLLPLQIGHAQTNNIQTYAYVNVAPNPCGIGQPVTVNFWLAVPHADQELVVNMTVLVTHPDGTTETLGPFTSDLTGGTYTRYTPTALGNYTFQFIYGGQTLVGSINAFGGPTFAGYVELPSKSAPVTLIVQQNPATGIPFTPLPTSWWQTPINAENVQNWADISGAWMGYSAVTFANTGGYNVTGNYNPYTTAPTTAHILWTKPWCIGGVAGRELGNDEQNSNFWTTSQYNPKFAPVIMNGIMYSTWYTTTTSSEQGIMATNLFTGETMWVINTTDPLRCGMEVNFENINQYGVVGPYIITQGGGGLFAPPGDWKIYDGMTGQYLCKITNTPSFLFLGQDANGNIIGYAFNNTAGTMYAYPNGRFGAFGNPISGVSYTIQNTTTYGPALEMFNLTAAMQQTALNWGIALGASYSWQDGIEWVTQSLPPIVNGIVTTGLGTSSFGYSAWSGNTLVMTIGATSVQENLGWLVEAGLNAQTGQLMWIQNRTGGVFTPYTRSNGGTSAAAGVYVEINFATYDMEAFSLTTGQKVWENSLNVPMSNGHMPNTYDEYGFSSVPDTTHGVLYVWALGGDVWAVNITTGAIIWSFSTVQANGDAGTETPYGIFPIWVFHCEALADKNSPVLYLSEGHEYSPPLFHGALVLALNGTTGELIWSNLAFDDTATAVAYGVMTTFNSYDGQVYAYAQGPSKTTVSAPQVGVSTATPVTITGTVTDVSAGASQEAVAANFPNGLPCVSDASMTPFMEAVYEQQAMPHNITGVPMTISVTDSNGNYRDIGTTTSNAYGTYSLTWTPDIPGDYTVTATFAGSGAYYPSSAATAFHATNPPATQAPTAAPAQNLATITDLMTYIAVAVIAIIIAIAIVGLLLFRKHA